MKCEYCDKLDHLESSCPSKKADKRKEIGLGLFFISILGPLWIIGAILGGVWSALKEGFQFSDGMWPQTWTAIRGKKKDDEEQIPD